LRKNPEKVCYSPLSTSVLVMFDEVAEAVMIISEVNYHVLPYRVFRLFLSLKENIKRNLLGI